MNLSTAILEDGIYLASRSPGEQMNVWKLGCRWGKGGPLFFDFLRNAKCVIGVPKISVYTRGDVILLTDGFHALGVALIVSSGTSVQGNSKYHELGEKYQVPDDVLAYDAEVYVLDQTDQFDYPMQQGIVQIRDSEYAQRTLKLVEKYKGRLDVQSPCQSHQSDEAHGEAPGGFSGLPTGIPELDDKLNGLRAAELIVVASRPGVGKTALAMQIAKSVARMRIFMQDGQVPQHAVAVFSLEVATTDLAKRMRCGIAVAATAPGQAPVIVDDTAGLDIQELCARARCMKARHNIKLIFIDYLQLCCCREFASQGRSIEALQIVKQITAMARELNIPVILTQQLCRSCGMRGDNTLRKLRPDQCDACKFLVQEAGAVLLLRRPGRDRSLLREEYNGIIVEVIKCDHGTIGEVRLGFDSFARNSIGKTPATREADSSEIVLIDFNNDKEHVANR